MDRINKILALFFAVLFLALPVAAGKAGGWIPEDKEPYYSDYIDAQSNQQAALQGYRNYRNKIGGYDYYDSQRFLMENTFYRFLQYKAIYEYLKSVDPNGSNTEAFRKTIEENNSGTKLGTYIQQQKKYTDLMQRKYAYKNRDWNLKTDWLKISKWNCIDTALGGYCIKIAQSNEQALISLRDGSGKKHYFSEVLFFYLYKKDISTGRSSFYKYWAMGSTPTCLYIKDLTQKYGEDLDACYKVTKENVLKTLAIAVVVGTAISYYTSIAIDFSTNIT